MQVSKTQKGVAPNRTCILIMGMHRSGTSMMAGVLDLLGCRSAEHLMPANFANERGYFETALISRLNDQMLKSIGSKWNDWTEIPPETFDTPDFTTYATQARQLLRDEFGEAPLFLLKDPRICRMMPFWQKTFEAEGVATLALHIHRNPLEVAQSLHKRDGMNINLAMLLWLRHVLEAERYTRGQSRHFVSYDLALQDWRKTVQNIAQGMAITWPRPPDDAQEAVGQFISRKLRHFENNSTETGAQPQLKSWIHESFAIFERWADIGENQDDYAKLNEIRQQFNQSTPILLALAGSLDAAEQSTADALTEVAAQISENAKAQQEIRAMEAELEATSKKLQDMQQVADHWTQKAAEQSAIIKSAQMETEITRHQLASTNTRLETLQAAVASERAQSQQAHEAALAAIRKDFEQRLIHIRQDFATTLHERAEAHKKLYNQQVSECRALQNSLLECKSMLEAEHYDKMMLLRSHSWRLTSPLRRLTTLFRSDQR